MKAFRGMAVWRVLRNPVAVSAAQIAAFDRLFPLGARPARRLNS